MAVSDEEERPDSLKPVFSSSVLNSEPESIDAELHPQACEVNNDQSKTPVSSNYVHRTSFSRRLSGRAAQRPALTPSAFLFPNDGTPTSMPADADMAPKKQPSAASRSEEELTRRLDGANRMLSQVKAWLRREQLKRRTKHRYHWPGAGAEGHATRKEDKGQPLTHGTCFTGSRPSSSDHSDSEIALEALSKIISSSSELLNYPPASGDEIRRDSQGRRFSRKKSSSRLLRKKSTGITSDSDQRDEDYPAAEVVLQNSKTLTYRGGRAPETTDRMNCTLSPMNEDEQETWDRFRSEIVRLSHTLKIPGWRRIPIEQGGELDVVRLSGALTNAVYVVSAPIEVFKSGSGEWSTKDGILQRRQPKKVLLRIYGPQAEHLIDREHELQILCRLSKKQIGPKLLGTFANGRFEEFFNARTLTAADLRIPETSIQIAKRMRELHDGIDLSPEERGGGPAVWGYWDKWKTRCEEIISFLDAQAHNVQSEGKETSKQMSDQLICGIEWPLFRKAVRDYRTWLYEECGGPDAINRRLIFAHNDTQYGNLLRLEPSGESPLLLPANSHRQLQVIDFEYASANVPGLEFANHFTEWCYDYHEEDRPYALREQRYPTIAEQTRFFKAYLQHNPPAQSRPSATPQQTPQGGVTSSISTFVLDSRAPPSQLAEEERERDEALEKGIERLKRETRVWRVANSAQWVAWGIVQASVPGMNEEVKQDQQSTNSESNLMGPNAQANGDGSIEPRIVPLSPSVEELPHKRPEGFINAEVAATEEVADAAVATSTLEETEGHFDYLGYAQERALFFWGDILQLGIVKREELPEELLSRVKMVEY